MNLVQALVVVFSILLANILAIQGLAYSGCFTLTAGVTSPQDLPYLGWTDKITLKGAENLEAKCVNHCQQLSEKYAAVETKGTETSCFCATERAYERLGVPFSTDLGTPCYNKVWALKTYIATGGASEQYIGCYKEVNDAANMASSSHSWIDKWVMSPNECMQYCGFNGAFYANLRKGDTCTCGYSFAKHGASEEASCDKRCVGSLGEICGGAQANSVYSTLALKDAARPSNQSFVIDFKTYRPANVPATQLLIQSMIQVQQAMQVHQPSKDAQVLKDHLTRASRFLQYITDMRVPLRKAVNSAGFLLSNSYRVSTWISESFPPELQKFVDVIKQSREFMRAKVTPLVDFVNKIQGTAGQLKDTINKVIITLKNYFDTGVLATGIEKTMQLAKMMISSSRRCIPLLGAAQQLMTSNLEKASLALLQGSHGIKPYIDNLKNPFSASAAANTVVPTVNTGSWRESLTEISASWSDFMSANGGPLSRLMENIYNESCTSSNAAIGRRAICEVSLVDMLKRPGSNAAKKDVQEFIDDHRVAFSVFNWDIYARKLSVVYDEFESIEEYLTKAAITTPQSIQQLLNSVTSFRYYQSCVERVTDLIKDVCHQQSKPNIRKVRPLQC